MDWKEKLSKVKPELPDKKAERRRLVGKEITKQMKLQAVRVSPTVIRKRWVKIG